MQLKEQLQIIAPDLRAQFRLSRLGVFGSVARGEETVTSDIDLIVEFDEPTPATLPERYFGLISELERLTKHPVQLLTPNMIKNPFFKRSIERDLEYLK